MPTVLITGASGGLGNYVLRRFADAQWTIIATTYSNNYVPIDYPEIDVIRCDLTDPSSASALHDKLPLELDAAVHLVGGIIAGKPIEETDTDDFTTMWKLNALSTYLVMRITIPLLKRSKGAFVAIGSRSVIRPEQNKSLYTAAKASVVHLVMAAAEEGRSAGMRANVIIPSIIRTPANLEWADERNAQLWVDPTDIAELTFFLCSPASKGITGGIIPMLGKLPG